jgi:hypothetical protein
MFFQMGFCGPDVFYAVELVRAKSSKQECIACFGELSNPNSIEGHPRDHKASFLAERKSGKFRIPVRSVPNGEGLPPHIATACPHGARRTPPLADTTPKIHKRAFHLARLPETVL